MMRMLILTPLSITQVVTGTGTKSVTLSVDQLSVTFEPLDNFNGDATFDYTVSDGNGGTSTTTATINVIPQNDDPVAEVDNTGTVSNAAVLTTDEDVSLEIPASELVNNDIDIDGDSLTISSVDKIINGGGTPSISTDFNIVTFSPDAQFNGDATFSYIVSDGNGVDNTIVTVSVTSVPDRPTAGDDSFATSENTMIAIPITAILLNDDDNDDDTLSVTTFDVTSSNGGTIVRNQQGTTSDPSDDTLDYTPANGFLSSPDDTFDYTVSDGALTDIGTISVTVTTFTVELDATQYELYHGGIVKVTDPIANTNPNAQDTVVVNVISTEDAIGFPMTLTETTNISGIFVSSVYLTFGSETIIDDNVLHTAPIVDSASASYKSKLFEVTIISDTVVNPLTVQYLPEFNCVGGSPDTDQDGICDTWENGFYNNQPGIDLPPGLLIVDESVGAPFYYLPCQDSDPDNEDQVQGIVAVDSVCPSAGTKDVYLEIDWMIGHEPDQDAINDVVQAFLNAPDLTIPADGTPDPIQLHVFKDESVGLHQTTIAISDDGGGTGGQTFDRIKSDWFGSFDDRNTSTLPDFGVTTDDNITGKRQVFHYGLFAHSNPDGGSGRAEVTGNDLLITLGAYEGGNGNRDRQAGTLMHELGHNFGLLHGGPEYAADLLDAFEKSHREANCKPNYLSVMSYTMQTSDLISDRPLDYSRHVLDPLNEDALLEEEGVGLYEIISGTPESTVWGVTSTPIPTGTGIDWNQSTGDLETAAVIADINNFGIQGCGVGTFAWPEEDPAITPSVAPDVTHELRSYNDWINLNLKFRGEGEFHDGVGKFVSNELGDTETDVFTSSKILAISLLIEGLADSGPIQDALIGVNELVLQENIMQALLELDTIRNDLILIGASSETIAAVDDLINSLIISIAPPNQPPIASDDSVIVDSTFVVISVLDNDADPEGDSLSIISSTLPENGQIIINLDGTITYTPNVGFADVDFFDYTISDDVDAENIQTDTATVTLTVQDMILPIIVAPADVTAEATGQTTVVSLGTPSVSDNADPNPSVFNDAPTAFEIGSTTVTWTAVDNQGNTSTDTQIVLIGDTVAPAFNPINDIVVFTPTTTTVNYVVVAIDAVDPAPSILCAPTSGSLFSFGSTTVNCTATDLSGNSGSVSFNVILQDNEAPIIVAPADVTVEATGQTTVVSLGTPSVSDNADPNPSVFNDAPTAFEIGSTIVTWTAVDNQGNTSTDTQIVLVQDSEPPTLSPRMIKENALESLQVLVTQDIDKKTKKDLEKSIKSLTKSLDDELWIDDSHLVYKDGKKVFKEEKKTVKELQKIVKKDKETPEVNSVISSVMVSLVDADAKLATTALDDAQEYAGDKKSDKQIKKAQKEITKAEKALAKEKYEKAISHYEKAWMHAIKAQDDSMPEPDDDDDDV